MTPEDRAYEILCHESLKGLSGAAFPKACKVLIADAIRAAAAEEREACAKVCEGIYRQYGEAVRECDTPEGHERLKNRGGGAGECATAVRARGK